MRARWARPNVQAAVQLVRLELVYSGLARIDLLLRGIVKSRWYMFRTHFKIKNECPSIGPQGMSGACNNVSRPAVGQDRFPARPAAGARGLRRSDHDVTNSLLPEVRDRLESDRQEDP